MNQIFVVGTSHHTAPLDCRERVSFSESQYAEAFRLLKDNRRIKEAVILSTCNRVEIYAAANSKDGCTLLFDFLSDYHQVDRRQLAQFTYNYQNLNAVRHLFNVVTSLDSMVVGEPQILGQVKAAYDDSLSAGASGDVLKRLFTKAIRVGKRVRTETDIGAGAVSISFVAVQLAKKIFQSLEDKTVVIIGAGEMSELTAKHLVENGVSKVIVANRTFGHAVEIAEKFSGTPLTYDANLNFLVDADIVITSTNASHHLIHRKSLVEIMRKRKHRYMFLIDIAVPRDVDPQVGEVENAFLYNIDDLEAVVASNLKERGQEAEIAAQIVETEAVKFYLELQALDVNPIIKALYQKFQGIASRELDICLDKAELSPQQQKIVESMIQSITKKLLHQPTTHLRQVAMDSDSLEIADNINEDYVPYVRALQVLFALAPVDEVDIEKND